MSLARVYVAAAPPIVASGPKTTSAIPSPSTWLRRYHARGARRVALTAGDRVRDDRPEVRLVGADGDVRRDGPAPDVHRRRRTAGDRIAVAERAARRPGREPALVWHALHDTPTDPPFRSVPLQLAHAESPWRFASRPCCATSHSRGMRVTDIPPRAREVHARRRCSPVAAAAVRVRGVRRRRRRAVAGAAGGLAPRRRSRSARGSCRPPRASRRGSRWRRRCALTASKAGRAAERRATAERHEDGAVRVIHRRRHRVALGARRAARRACPRAVLTCARWAPTARAVGSRLAARPERRGRLHVRVGAGRRLRAWSPWQDWQP